ncbi:MAG: nicotinamide riboside transporter PnuC [Bacteroidota bacterium]
MFELTFPFLGFNVPVLEFTAVVFGFLSVWLNTRQNIWVWPTGLVSVALYVLIFFDARLYADMGLQGVYIVLSLYGWWAWLYGGPEGDALPITRLTPKHGAILGAIGIAAMIGIGLSLDRLTDADIPYWDAFTTAFSLVAQWLMAKKILEHWLVWIVVDAVAIGVYIYKDLYLTAGLFAAFLVLAAIGYVAWRKDVS